MRIRSTALSLVLVLLAAPAFAQVFTIGTVGTAAGVNNWPAAELPSAAINGEGQKYLNFGKLSAGVAVAPATGAAAPTSITVWAANDSPDRDPASFAIYGTNAAASGAPGSTIGGLTLVATGALALPADRNLGGVNPLLATTSATATFTNAATFPTYVVVFPTLKNAVGANSLQFADVQLFDAAGGGIFAPTNAIVGGQILIPEPSTILMGSIGLALAALRRRRRG